MSAQDVFCPNCNKPIKVTAELAGKRVRCKACSHVFTVPGGEAATPAAAAKPVQPKAPAKPAKAKPQVVEDDPPPPAAGAAPIGFMEEDEGPKEYKVTKDDLDMPRCPRCANELEQEDDRICLNCGYDMTERRQHRTVKTYNQTGGDVFLYWLPAIIWAVVLLCLAGVLAFMMISLRGFMLENEILVKDEVNSLTGEKEFWVGPGACTVSCSVMWLALASFGVPVIFRRLKNPKPAEVEKKK